MVKSMENGVSVAPFLVKCYEMVDDESTNELISWSQSNNSFIIWDETKFASELLPKYFKHSNMASFVRQLNIYGFRKIDTDRYEFASDGFLKGQKHLLKTIIRRKQSQSQVQRKSELHQDIDSCPSEDDKRVALSKEVENLKTDKNALTQELIKLRQHQKTSQTKMLLLGEQLKGMEKNQQQMLSFIVMAMQSPGFMVQLLQPKENNWFSPVKDNSERALADGAMVKYQPPNSETTLENPCSIPTLISQKSLVKYQPPNSERSLENTCSTPTLSSQKSMEWELSSDEVSDLLRSFDLTPGPWDGKLQSFENENDHMIEQIFMSSPPSEIEDAARQYPEACVDTQMEMAQSFDQNNEMSEYETELEDSERVDNLTEQQQMVLLNSKRSLKF